MQEHPGRVLQAINRIQDVLMAEYDDLSPPDVHFALIVLSSTYIEMFQRQVANLPKGSNT